MNTSEAVDEVTTEAADRELVNKFELAEEALEETDEAPDPTNTVEPLESKLLFNDEFTFKLTPFKITEI